jgi:hypothetical protein
MLESVTMKLNDAFSPANISATAGKIADFAPGKPLSADFVYRAGSEENEAFAAYLALMPEAVKEVIRAAMQHAMSSGAPMMFRWQPAYYFNVSVTQWPATKQRQGAVAMTIEGPLPGDQNSVVRNYSMLPPAGASRKVSKRGAPKPASRKPSKRSKRSS